MSSQHANMEDVVEQGPREVVDPKVDMTLMKIRAVIRAKPRYHPYFAAIRKRCIDDQLEYYDLYDMPPAEVNRILGVVGDFSRVLLKNAVDEANAVLEKGKGFTCEVCHQPFPYIRVILIQKFLFLQLLHGFKLFHFVHIF